MADHRIGLPGLAFIGLFLWLIGFCLQALLGKEPEQVTQPEGHGPDLSSP